METNTPESRPMNRAGEKECPKCARVGMYRHTICPECKGKVSGERWGKA